MPSVAWPLKSIGSPTAQSSVAGGVSMTGAGSDALTTIVVDAVPLADWVSVTRRPTV